MQCEPYILFVIIFERLWLSEVHTPLTLFRIVRALCARGLGISKTRSDTSEMYTVL